MHPDRVPGGVRDEIILEPVRCHKKLLPAACIFGAHIGVVIAQPKLSDGNRVILPSKGAAVIQQWNTLAIEGARVIRLGEESHVVFAKIAGAEMVIHFWFLVPKSELAGAVSQISAENAPVILEARPWSGGLGGQLQLLMPD